MISSKPLSSLFVDSSSPFSAIYMLFCQYVEFLLVERKKMHRKNIYARLKETFTWFFVAFQCDAKLSVVQHSIEKIK